MQIELDGPNKGIQIIKDTVVQELSGVFSSEAFQNTAMASSLHHLLTHWSATNVTDHNTQLLKLLSSSFGSK